MSKYWLGQLRHAYKNVLDGAVKQHVELANHLLAPAIADAERYVTENEDKLDTLAKAAGDLAEEVVRLKKIEAAARKLYKVLQGTMAAQSPTGLELGQQLGMGPNTEPVKK